MRSALLIAFHFPPIGGAGVQRNVQLVRGLPEHGYTPVVLTGARAPDYRWTPTDDAVAVEESTLVHRLVGTEPPHGARWESRLERWVRLPARWQRWWSSQLRLAAAMTGDVDLVRASLAPYAIGPVVVEMARKLGKPLVFDLEDPWALDEMMVYPTRVHRRLELRKMQAVLRAADAVVMNTPEAAERVVDAFPELDGRVRAIPNAFDPSDFVAPALARSDSRFRIVHTGSMHMDSGLRQREANAVRRLLGGSVDGVDFLTRSHVFLLEAIDRLLERRPDLRDIVQVHFAGVLTPAEQESLGRVPYATLHGFLSHRDTIALIRSADLLFLPMHDLPRGRRATIVPHKTYEYIASGRPILAAVPDGDARELLAEAGTARLCRPSDSAAMVDIIGLELDQWRAGVEPPELDPGVRSRCGSVRLVSEMAAVFDNVVSGR